MFETSLGEVAASTRIWCKAESRALSGTTTVHVVQNIEGFLEVLLALEKARHELGRLPHCVNVAFESRTQGSATLRSDPSRFSSKSWP